jgi:hypothetical protein
MRQKSRRRRTRDLRLDAGPPARRPPCPGSRGPRARRRDGASVADRAQSRSDPSAATPRSLTRRPAARPCGREPRLDVCRHRRSEQHQLRPPPQPCAVLLRLVRDDTRGLQVIEPALHTAPMSPNEPRARSYTARHRSPAHDRREPDDELLDRRRKARRARRVPEPEGVALHRVHARLQAIVPRRRATARPTRPTQQRRDDQAPGLRRQRLARRPIPTTRRTTAMRRECAFQRHRQRPRAPSKRSRRRARADARGAAGRASGSRRRCSKSAGRTWPPSRG